jgi:PleD family two-component response regulator
MERVRGELARLRTIDGGAVRCSIGLVTFIRPPASLDEVEAAGDGLLYRAKDNGKDRIEQAERSGAYQLAGD